MSLLKGEAGGALRGLQCRAGCGGCNLHGDVRCSTGTHRRLCSVSEPKPNQETGQDGNRRGLNYQYRFPLGYVDPKL